MSANQETPSVVQVRPPQLIHSLVSGFNAVTNHVYLILIPAALDLLLWLGPHIRMKKLIEPVFLEISNLLRQSSTLDMRQMWDGMDSLVKIFLEQYNLLSRLSTFPVGVPALMAAIAPTRTPLGAAPVIELTTSGQVVLYSLLLTLAGLALGTLYFAWVAQGCASSLAGLSCPDNTPGRREAGKIPSFRPNVLAWQLLQVILMMILLVIIAMIVLVPTILLASFLSLVSAFIAQAVMLLLMFSAVWFLVPLVFSPHGIFICGQGIFNAMLSSVKVVRFSLPGTGLFLLVVIVLYQGLGVLWRVPPDNSWMALVGIFGHSFIATGLLAASFIYYRSGLSYAQALRKITFPKINI